MKTCTFQDILNQAAEYAQRTRDKILAREQTMLQGFLATEFEQLFNSQPWSFLIPEFVEVTNIVNNQTSLNEGTATEFGDILAVLSANPHLTDYWRHIKYSLGDNVIYFREPVTTVYIEAMLPYPGTTFQDLAEMTLANFLAATCPRQWRQYLARKAAAELLNQDGNPADAGVQMGLAERAIAAQIQRFTAVPPWRGFRSDTPRWGLGQRTT